MKKPVVQATATKRKPRGQGPPKVPAKPLRADVDKVMQQESFTFNYLPTILGPGKVSVNDREYAYHFKSQQVKFYRCEKPNCPAKVITKLNQAWIFNGDHNHSD